MGSIQSPGTSRCTETQFEEARAIARNEASMALDRFRKKASSTPLGHRDREQIIQDPPLDLVPRVTALAERNLPLPVYFFAEDVSLLIDQLEPLLCQRLTNVPLTAAWPLAQQPLGRLNVFRTEGVPPQPERSARYFRLPVWRLAASPKESIGRTEIPGDWHGFHGYGATSRDSDTHAPFL